MTNTLRHTWGACLSTSIGSIVHELGHCFDLVHTDAGVMARGFDDINRYFTLDLADSEEPRSAQSSKLTIVRFESKQDAPERPRGRTSSFTKISQTNRGSELLGRYYHKQDYEQMRSDFGGSFFTRQCALLLFYHRSLKFLMNRADRKSQVRQCFGFFSADSYANKDKKSAAQNPKHWLT